jgi:hypothetical protein
MTVWHCRPQVTSKLRPAASGFCFYLCHCLMLTPIPPPPVCITFALGCWFGHTAHRQQKTFLAKEIRWWREKFPASAGNWTLETHLPARSLVTTLTELSRFFVAVMLVKIRTWNFSARYFEVLFSVLLEEARESLENITEISWFMSESEIYVCTSPVIFIYEDRLQSSWTHFITPSRHFVEVRWRPLILSTSLSKWCTSLTTLHPILENGVNGRFKITLFRLAEQP